MENESTVVATYMFRGIEYVVTMNIGDNLVVEVEDRMTADQWRGNFDNDYIEDLTHKTGNFKQFSIFVSMLESALTQNSDSVSLDLLTYSDLEALRNRKTGSGSRNMSQPKNASLNSKRYLILTYTVEFDRIHYPLPLNYMGKPDPRALQESIRQLRQEIKKLKAGKHKEARNKEHEKLKKEYEKLKQEKEDLEDIFVEYKREVSSTTTGAAHKEIKMLKTIIKNLEEDLILQKTKHQRSSSKRNQEFCKLADEVEELRASERNLKARVKSLNNELSLYKRSKSNTSVGSRKNSSYQRDRSSSRERSYPRINTSNHSLHSGRHSNVNSRDNSYTKDYSRYSSLSARSKTKSPRESFSFPRERSRSREKSSHVIRRTRSNSAGSYTGRSPSPGNNSFGRFDPTAYIKEKERKIKEAELKQKRQRKPGRGSSSERIQRPSSSPAYSDRSQGRRRPPSRTSSVGSLRSRTSSVESLSDIGMASDSSETRVRNGPRHFRNGRIGNAWKENRVPSKKPPTMTNKSQKILSSTPEGRSRQRPALRDKENHIQLEAGDSDFFDRSAEISEIDARLQRLQDFMKTNLS